MKNTFGNSISVTLFGESHSSHIGAVLDGMPAGIKVNEDFIRHQLSLRRPFSDISTARIETDNFQIVSGVFNGKTTGTPICIIIENTSQISSDYEAYKTIARPSHADYTAHCKYNGFEDYRGGGHFSGRITAALVAVGAIVISALKEKNIHIGTHIKRCAGIEDKPFSDLSQDVDRLNSMQFAVNDEVAGKLMQEKILQAKNEGDSVGGILETAVIGLPAGIGEPWFDSLEGQLSHILFSVPSIKGVEFGAGFGIADMYGSQANDVFRISDGKIITETNNNGGINGGISNGMPIIFRCAVKPTPSICKEQNTVDFVRMENTKIQVSGRHDPAIIHRARVVIDSVTALAIYDLGSEIIGK
ncbi:MAG: chorismate synthase [Ruminococcus sp.]|nr:chorismate synthase [Candidatus Copronaster equi]